MKKYVITILLSLIIGWLFRQYASPVDSSNRKLDSPTDSQKLAKKSHSPKAIITNILEPNNTWIRLELTYSFDSTFQQAEIDKISDILVQDTILYLRTLRLSSLEGPLGLIHLREDLLDRANLRVQKKHIEVYIRTMVLQ